MEVWCVAGYHEFSCIGSACTASCCKGWRVYIDDPAILRFQTEPGLLGIRLRLAMWHGGRLLPLLPESILEQLYGEEGDATDYINRNSGRCPFLNHKGLCSLQLKKGADFLPSICRRYPRQIRRMGERSELLLDLTCIHAADLFLKRAVQGDPRAVVQLLPVTEEAQLTSDEKLLITAPEGEMAGDDPVYLSTLLSSRDHWLSRVAAAETPQELDLVMGQLIRYTAQVQQRLATGGRMDEVSWPSVGDSGSRSGAACFPFSIMTYHALMQTEIWQPMLQRTSPLLYEYIERYYAYFTDLTEIEAQRLLTDLVTRLYTIHPQIHAELRALLLYSILQAFPAAYGDYSLHTHLLTALLEVDLILLFAALNADTAGRVDLPQIISVCLRRIRHNEAVRHQCLAVLYEHL